MKKRFNCPRCLRPCSHCFCPLVQPVACGVELLILQHPLEHGHAKNTARLLHLCLPGSRLEVGECFAPAQLAQWLAAADKRSVLLYPPSAPDPQLPLHAPPALPALWVQAAELPQLRLVVLDGTWRKSRKMLYLNPLLQALPRLPLVDLPASQYRIRKAQQAHQLSSFEASVAALAQLHALGGAQADGLQAVFQAWLGAQSSSAPPR